MKKILIAFALVAALALPALAQNTPTYNPQSLSVPAVATAGTATNGIAAVIDCRKQQNVALQLNPGGATNTTWRFSASVDGSTYLTNYYVIGITNLPTLNAGLVVTNLNVAGVGYLRLDSILAAGTINATNTASYGIKISSP